MSQDAGTMPAWVQRSYGGAETVSLAELPIPAPRPDQVQVRVRATGLNAADVRIMRGDPLLVRLAFGLRRPRQPVRGMDIAGTIAAIGTAVEGFAIGDEVVAEADGGGLAPLVAVAASRLALRPDAVAPDAAAALPLAGGTAAQALDRAGVDGGRVLVIGASGGVGTFAVQLAALRGAEVWALCGAHSQQLVEGLGASRSFDYRQTDAADLPHAWFDAIIEIAGSASLKTLVRLLAPGGTLVLVGGEGGRALGPIPRMLRAALMRKGAGRRIRPLTATADAATLRELLELTAAGRLAPVIEHRFGFDEAQDALARQDSGRVVGKLVVRTAPES